MESFKHTKQEQYLTKTIEIARFLYLNIKHFRRATIQEKKFNPEKKMESGFLHLYVEVIKYVNKKRISFQFLDMRSNMT